MYGRLALHAESVVMPLLVPDVPVVTWWHGEPPAEIATDFLGVVADRRITDCAQAVDPIEALRERARDYSPGDTDLAWTRITPWRTLVAGAFDTTEARVTEATVVAPRRDPTAALMQGWLAARLGIQPQWQHTDDHPRMRQVQLRCANGDELTLTRDDGMATFRRTGQDDRMLPLVRRPLGDELAEELRRLDADQVYAEALGTAAGLSGLEQRPAQRVHVWKDPATARRADGVRRRRPARHPDRTAGGGPRGRPVVGASRSLRWTDADGVGALPPVGGVDRCRTAREPGDTGTRRPSRPHEQDRAERQETRPVVDRPCRRRSAGAGGGGPAGGAADRRAGGARGGVDRADRRADRRGGATGRCATVPAHDAVDWSRVDIWWGDERFLPAGDPERNETQARAALLDLLPLDPARVHPMPASDGPDGDDPEAAPPRTPRSWRGRPGPVTPRCRTSTC